MVKLLQVSGDERFHDKPDKNKYSHPCEAAQYLMLGAGEGRSVIPRRRNKAEDDRKIEKYYRQIAAGIV